MNAVIRVKNIMVKDRNLCSHACRFLSKPSLPAVRGLLLCLLHDTYVELHESKPNYLRCDDCKNKGRKS